MTGGDGAADLVLAGGRVTTGVASLDDGGPTAPAVGGGRVRLVGSDDAVLADWAGPSTRVVPLGGRRVIPGLIDSHLHAVRAGLTWTSRVDWSGVPTLAEALSRVSAAAAGRRDGDWVAVVGGWHPGQFAERRGPTSEELTEAAPRHPRLRAAALRVGGAERGRGDGASAAVRRCSRTGRRSAVALALIGSPSFAGQVASTETFLRRLSAVGVTGVIDPGGGNLGTDAYRAVMELWRRGPLPVRLRLYVSNSGSPTARAGADPRVRPAPHPGFGDESPCAGVRGRGRKLVNAHGDGERACAPAPRPQLPPSPSML